MFNISYNKATVAELPCRFKGIQTRPHETNGRRTLYESADRRCVQQTWNKDTKWQAVLR